MGRAQRHPSGVRPDFVMGSEKQVHRLEAFSLRPEIAMGVAMLDPSYVPCSDRKL